ncbi:DUF2524 domain-containing protein [Paenibacillus cremeus]|uniref:DUF2524 domain-containing protein n=1 Tax=Paenibacillus cremeus TaxID=2163881 RepID=A0A559KHB7_9BACL|nr:DUF2524 domain-containing protein [Paenibacillus cremeus]TVY11521.1 DUF2524 domain-containing protein [Paenibacillus cremeus]
MIDNLESNYNCASAGTDLHELQSQLDALQSSDTDNLDTQQQVNRLENQIRFIKNKCDIHP